MRPSDAARDNSQLASWKLKIEGNIDPILTLADKCRQKMLFLTAIEIGHKAMKIGPQHLPTTKISTSNANTIVARGYDLAENLIGNVTFTDHVWLLVAGELPSVAQRQILDAALVAIAEHGVVPSIAAARMTLAAAPESIPGTVVAGLIGCGSVILGASDAAERLFDEFLERSAGDGMSVDDATRIVLGEYRAARKLIAGYGHPVHKGGVLAQHDYG